MLEKAYQECLLYKLNKDGFRVEKEKAMPLYFDGVHLDCGFRIDILVENQVVLEIKSVKQIDDIHLAQILTYMKIGKFDIGLILNFNVLSLKDGIKRVVL